MRNLVNIKSWNFHKEHKIKDLIVVVDCLIFLIQLEIIESQLVFIRKTETNQDQVIDHHLFVDLNQDLFLV